MKLGMVILFCGALSIPAQARLGENEKDCDARYGDPVSTNVESGCTNRIYQKGQFRITVTLVDGKCEALMYENRPKGTWSNEQILAVDLDHLLDANCQEKKWILIDLESEAAAEPRGPKHNELWRKAVRLHTWMRTDNAQATYDSLDRVFLLWTDRFRARQPFKDDTDGL